MRERDRLGGNVAISWQYGPLIRPSATFSLMEKGLAEAKR